MSRTESTAELITSRNTVAKLLSLVLGQLANLNMHSTTGSIVISVHRKLIMIMVRMANLKVHFITGSIVMYTEN